jgi:hypothetical protein
MVPQADKVLHLIQRAGPQGISYGQLAANVTLEPETIAAVLQALLDFAQVVVSMEGEQRIYRCR